MGFNLAEIRAHLDKIGIDLFNNSRMVDLQITHVAGIGIIFGWPTWRSPGHRRQDLDKHFGKLMELEKASQNATWITNKMNVAKTRKLYGIKWNDNVCLSKMNKNNFKQGFYRCLVIEAGNEDEILVCFIDYGDCARVSKCDLFELETQYVEIPIICKAFLLYEMPLKLLPPPLIRKSKSLAFNNPKWKHLLKWLEDILINGFAQVVPTKDIQSDLRMGKLKSYTNESGDFGVMLITSTGTNVNDEFKREFEKATEKYPNCYEDDESTLSSIPEEQLEYLLSEEDSNMMNELIRVQQEHKIKRKAFMWKAEEAEKLLMFTQAMELHLGNIEENEIMGLISFWETQLKDEIEMLRTTEITVKSIEECIHIKEKLKPQCNSAKNDTIKHLRDAYVSIKKTQSNTLEYIKKTENLDKIKENVRRKLSDLNTLKDEWVESFAFLNYEHNCTDTVYEPPLPTLQSIISAIEQWIHMQKKNLNCLFDETKDAVHSFCQEQKKQHKNRLKNIKMQRNPMQERKGMNSEQEKTCKFETAHTNCNPSSENPKLLVREKYQVAICSINNETQSFEKLRKEKMYIENTAQKKLDELLPKTINTLQDMLDDIMFVLAFVE